MKWQEAFPSNYLNATDIPSDGMLVTLMSFTMVDVNDDGNPKSIKPVFMLKETEKGLICNQTNAAQLEGWFGDEPEMSLDHQVMLICQKVQYGRRWVDGIRFMPAPMADATV